MSRRVPLCSRTLPFQLDRFSATSGLALLASVALLPGPSHAQVPTTPNSCGQIRNVEPGAFEASPLGQETHTFLDGGDGDDTLRWEGPSFLVAGRGRFANFEQINLQNGLFDTVIVLGEMLKSAEGGEIEVAGDWFDMTILDPRLEWTRAPSASFSHEVFTAHYDDEEVRVLVRPGDFAVSSQALPALRTTEGPLGAFSLEHPNRSERVDRYTARREGDPELSFRWLDGGSARPAIGRGHEGERVVEFDFRNGAPNLIELASGHLATHGETLLRLIADDNDKLIVVDPECWHRAEQSDPDLAGILYEHEDGRVARVVMDKALLAASVPGAPRIGHADVPGVWHLSSDARRPLDAIDLTNGGKDVLVLRNDGRLRQQADPIVIGDPGLDEVWLDGTAKWSILLDDYGVIAQTPSRSGESPQQIRFGSGLSVRQMPMPDFLMDPGMLTQPHYPGAVSDPPPGRSFYVTRGGYVGFSQEQLAGREMIDMTNGRQNILHLNRAALENVADTFEVQGDSELDMVLATDLPAPEIREDGSYVWRLGDGLELRTIIAIAVGIIR